MSFIDDPIALHCYFELSEHLALYSVDKEVEISTITSNDGLNRGSGFRDVIGGRPHWQPLLLADPEKRQSRRKQVVVDEVANRQQTLVPEVNKPERYFF
jgi:hypothetical protein